ncbi:NAD(P)H-binding protein [Lactiplantibacillus plantarum]|uniref:NAD(P)H-binding protein n=1 Tax=Lactiplantibacillus plantarum TaxID=1590 RepID=UPI000FECE26C|nr:NAD(P)H-binding protein [Lactiplantibacillus plantarum]QAR38582.1 NAD-dependent epimerase/dehydratase family protein [Lactiplantibacillus plantarum]RWZ08756.1 NAD-dependent epimerase/dehydratase family protein [Lactiplantibacillus plantarum]RWZ36597.1 NAD-dependent epimerase/dehydratase family protein [Lactiplantibacillus plantarum]
MKVMILGAAGQIGQMVTRQLLAQTDDQLVLYGHNVSQRLTVFDSTRVTFVDGDFLEFDKVQTALNGVDAVYLSFVAGPDIIAGLIKALDATGVKRLIVASIPDLYQEVSGPFQQWYREHTGIVWQSDRKQAADLIEASDLDYVLLRITWLYNQTGNTAVTVTKKGEPFTSAQVTRQAAAQFVVNLLAGKGDYHRESLGLGEPQTEFSKPNFY